jgi:iron complex transport system ATP-binding protein
MGIRFKDVVSTVGKTQILKGVSLSAEDGRMTGIVGPNGSGKSTLAKVFFSLAPLTNGNMFLDGEDVSRIKPKTLARRAAYMGQEMQCAFDFTVREIIAMGCFPHQTRLFRNRSAKSAVDEALETLHIQELSEHNIQTLSGGEKRTAFLARTIAQGVDTIILDEPTNSLDIQRQLFILDYLKKSRKTILIVIHDLNLAARYCDELYLMYQGKTITHGLTEEVLSPQYLQTVFGVNGRVMHNENGQKSFILL